MMTIHDYIRETYPSLSPGLRTGAVNAFMRHLSLDCDFPLEVEDFFEYLEGHTDEQLYRIRNMTHNKINFLRLANADWRALHPKDPHQTRFNYIGEDWTRVKNHCRTTVNKQFTENEPGEQFKRDLLISEHSPIRLLEVDWSWEDIPSWVATHFSRHKFEKFISTQRDDRKEHDISRADMPQGTPVKFDGFANAQNLIDAWRKRLCYQAAPETRKLAEDFKLTLHEVCPELADVLVPNCVYRCGCPEFSGGCGWFKKQMFYQSDIRLRYEKYNEWFYRTH